MHDEWKVDRSNVIGSLQRLHIELYLQRLNPSPLWQKLHVNYHKVAAVTHPVVTSSRQPAKMVEQTSICLKMICNDFFGC